MLTTLRARGVGVLTDHNVHETLSLCDRAYVLFAGHVLAGGNTQTLLADAQVTQRFLRETFDAGLGSFADIL